jgi:hypothetical protein
MKSSTTRLMILGVLFSMASAPALAADANKKFCLNPASGGSSCGFTSMEQCQETMRGRNGWCSEQVDFGSAPAHGMWSIGHPNDSFAYYGGGENFKSRRMQPADKALEELEKRDMPKKGVGAQ